ncbi:isoprenylcysteine carboxylmethyltransferase family protein [Candidatus Woesearchaeota archaeon]|nr:isoprenylcysteine carboxylmethyltransferase family protein [Candidatus Woesearchaeota archaeon]
MNKPRLDVANLFLVFIILNVILHYIIPIKQLIFIPYSYIGIVLFVLGWVPNIWLGIYFRKLGTSIPTRGLPKHLVTTGLFRFSRNPIYLGMVLALFGEAVFLGSLITFIIPVLFIVLINKFNIPIEEKNLELKFGKRYLDYKAKVRRWI